MNAVARLLRRPDFRSHPVRALWRRVFWRLRWSINKSPWLHSLGGGLTLATPRAGISAMIYYWGRSEPETAAFILRFLRPGMVVIDVGAHFGEYTLIAARAVGDTGHIHAFEPHPDVFGFLSENVRRNRLTNVELNRVALAESGGDRRFELGADSAVSSLRPADGGNETHPHASERTISVVATTLDAYCSAHPGHVDLVKIDVEGAELLIFQGAAEVLARPRGEAPVWIFEYSTENCPRFGYSPEALVEHLASRGYEVLKCAAGGRLGPFRGEPSSPTFNLVATKEPEHLQEMLEARRNARG